jgi:hypothetical protein
MDTETMLLIGAGVLLLPTLTRTAETINKASDAALTLVDVGITPFYVIRQPLTWIKELGDDDRWFS